MSLKSTDAGSFLDCEMCENLELDGSRKGYMIHDALKKIRNFEHTSGHTYGDDIAKPKRVPDPYNIASSNESYTKQAMSKPKGHMNFSKFRDQITTRIDRSDPNWGMSLNYEDLHINPEFYNKKSSSFLKMSARKPNEVKSRYPIRQNMSLMIPHNTIE